MKPGQTQAGSGTTPTLLAGGKLVAITDNADPINVLAFQRAVRPHGKRLVCKEPVFEEGASATDQSLIGAGRTLIAENNHGYSIPNTQFGRHERAGAPGGPRQPRAQRLPHGLALGRDRAVGGAEGVLEDGPRLHLHEAGGRP